jgi:hypothetical protein
LAPISNVENVAFRENEAVSSILDGQRWRPDDLGVYNYFGLVLDKSKLRVG